MILLGPLHHLIKIPFSSLIRKKGWQLSMSWVWLGVEPWCIPCSTPIRYGICTIQFSYSSGSEYLDLHDHLWITSLPGRDTLFNLDQKKRMTAELVMGVVGGEMWLMVCSTPIRYDIFTIQFSYSSRPVYSDLHDPLWTTSSPGRDTIFKLDQKQTGW